MTDYVRLNDGSSIPNGWLSIQKFLTRYTLSNPYRVGCLSPITDVQCRLKTKINKHGPLVRISVVCLDGRHRTRDVPDSLGRLQQNPQGEPSSSLSSLSDVQQRGSELLVGCRYVVSGSRSTSRDQDGSFWFGSFG